MFLIFLLSLFGVNFPVILDFYACVSNNFNEHEEIQCYKCVASSDKSNELDARACSR